MFQKWIVFLCVLLCALLLWGCTGFSNNQTVPSGSLDYYVSDTGRRAFPAVYRWSGDPADTRIEIPDEMNGANVETIGGYFGTGNPIFLTITTEGDFSEEELVMPEGTQPEYVTFTLWIGKNIRTVVGVEFVYDYLPVRRSDGSVRYYIPLINVECDERNKTFYSKGGKLYRVEDDAQLGVIRYGTPSVDFTKGTLSVYGTSTYVTEYEWVKTSYGVILTKYEGPWQYSDEISREDCIVAQADGNYDLYRELCAALREADVNFWDGFHETDPRVLDGGGFSFSMDLERGGTISASGTNAYPEGYRELTNALEDLLLRESTI